MIAPAAAFTMAILLFVYTRTSIRAAKANAQRHRDADTGGEGLSLLNEHRRRHGMAKKVEGDGGGTIVELGRQLLGRNKVENSAEALEAAAKNEEEEKLRVMKMKLARKGELEK
jgi:hypothetical protein